MTTSPTPRAASSAHDHDHQRPARPNTTWAALLLGVPMAIGLLVAVQHPVFQGTLVQRYTSHPVEKAELVMFCCALGALGVKLWQSLFERRALRMQVLPAWNGNPVPFSEAPRLLGDVSRLGPRWQRTWVVQRTQAILSFLCQRQSTRELDDHLRTLSDNDNVSLDSSYALVRFLCWGTPILGFLGTVLGIADAIAGVTPEVLEQSISSVTEGLALAFDTTGLALILTMGMMFFSFIMERVEQGILEQVEEFVDLHLAHRFVRPDQDAGPYLDALQQNSAVLLQGLEQVTRQQATIWASALTQAEVRLREVEQQQQGRLIAALTQALEQTLAAHETRLSRMEQATAEQTARVMTPLVQLAQTVQEQQRALHPLTEGMTQFGQTLARLHEEEGTLLRLQQALHENLSLLASSGAFEEAVHSLSAVIHLLTARVSGLRHTNWRDSTGHAA